VEGAQNAHPTVPLACMADRLMMLRHSKGCRSAE
jgi:hypothetical protein